MAVLLLATSITWAGDDKLALKTGTTAPPAELADPIRKLMPPSSMQVTDVAGHPVGEFWFRQDVPTDATPTQIKNGLTYRELRQTELLGAVRLDREFIDSRKQKIKAGVYTLRLGFQPAIDDHVGVSDHQEFLLLTAAELDATADIVEPKEMIARSIKTLGKNHPAVLMLFPLAKPAALSELQSRPKKHVTLNTRLDLVTEGKKSGAMGLSVTIVGHAE